jgi:predicted nucleic acid-binding protein
VTGWTLDSGALIGLERGDPRVRALLRRAFEQDRELHVVAGVVAQVWRGGPRQARVARLLHSRGVRTVDLDDATARAVGQLCGASGHADIVDVHVALHARLHDHAVVTSDPDDLRRLDASLRLIEV